MEPLDLPADTPPSVIDPAIVEQLLSDRGAIYVDPDTFKSNRMFGVLVPEEAMDMKYVGESEDDLLAAKDDILRDLDTRLTKILDL